MTMASREERERLKRSLRNTLTMMVKMGADLPVLLDVMQEVVDEHRKARKPRKVGRADPQPELCQHDDPSWCTQECKAKIQRLREWMQRRTMQ
jgi:hypothetical protein